MFSKALALLFYTAPVYAFVSSPVSTDNSFYGYYLTQAARPYVDSLKAIPTDNWSNLPANQKSMCARRYSGILKDGVIDIRIAMGYFDWTTGSPIVIGNENHGYSPSIDPSAYESLREFLLAPCAGNLEFCGFRQNGGDPHRFTKEVRIQGVRYTAQVQVHFASVTEWYNVNMGERADEQRQSSQSMDAYFANAFNGADVVMYFGHSRNGGGPDFNPPRLLSDHKVDYAGYYKVVRPGFKKLLADLDASHNQPAIFGLMSCDSRDHFLDRVSAKAPHMGVITSTAILSVYDVYTAMIGALDSVLRGQCQHSFYQEIRMNSRNQEFITMDHVFE